MTGEEFDKTVAPIRALIAKKGQDYNHAVKLEEYFPFGDRSHVQMIYVKAMRLRSLVQQDRQPNFDSVLDTAQDLLAYTAFYLDFLEKKNGKPV